MTPAENFIRPNAWAEHIEECGKTRIRREVVSKCYYEHVFSKYSIFMNENLMGRGPTDCEQDTEFSSLTYIDDPEHKRPSCYHIETFYGFEDIPEDRNVQGADG